MSGGQQELVSSKVGDGKHQHESDRPVELTACYVGDGLGSVDVGFALDTVGRDLIGPGEKYNRCESERQYQQNGLHDPARCADVVQHQVGDLGQQPRRDDIGNGDTKNVTSL